MNLSVEELQLIAFLCFAGALLLLISGGVSAWWGARHQRQHEKEVRRGIYAAEEEDG